MSPEMQIAHNLIDERAQVIPAPASWKVWDCPEPDAPQLQRVEADGWVLATNDDLDICGDGGEMKWHFVLSSHHLKAKPTDFQFKQTELGGVICEWPLSYFSQAHIRQFHFQFPPVGDEFETLRRAAGTPIKIKIEGWLHHAPHPTGMTNEEIEASVFGAFKRFDLSSRCPVIEVETVEIAGKPRAQARDILHIRIPFTRRHIGLSLIRWSYDRPADPPSPQQLIRAAQPMPTR